MPKKPEPTFTILLKGTGVYPEEIPWQKVFDMFKAVHQLVKPDEPAEDEDGALRLIGVTRGSAAFQFYAKDAKQAVDSLRRTGRMLETGDLPEDAALRVTPIEDLSRIARSLGCSILIRKDRKHVLATIHGESYQDLVGSLIVNGETTISGKVERVGGATERRCTLRVAFRRALLYCDVASKEIARDLGQHLYQDVVATGSARWLKTNWDIVGFRIGGLQPAPQGSLSEAFQALRSAGGDAWDKVEKPDELLKKVRG